MMSNPSNNNNMPSVQDLLVEHQEKCNQEKNDADITAPKLLSAQCCNHNNSLLL